MVMDMKTHEILAQLYERSGYSSYKDLAQGMGLADASSVQRYFKEGGRKGKYLSSDVVEKFCNALVSRGNPPITEAEVWALAAPVGKVAPALSEDINHSLDALLGLYSRSSLDVKRKFRILIEHDIDDGDGDPGVKKTDRPQKSA
jgi:hypothetical protein